MIGRSLPKYLREKTYKFVNSSTNQLSTKKLVHGMKSKINF
jgi:hypothetical protein